MCAPCVVVPNREVAKRSIWTGYGAPGMAKGSLWRSSRGKVLWLMHSVTRSPSALFASAENVCVSVAP